jgi:hypothetical protein
MFMSNVPAPMHPRYTEFLAFMAECPHRKTPSTLETSFVGLFDEGINQD